MNKSEIEKITDIAELTITEFDKLSTEKLEQLLTEANVKLNIQLDKLLEEAEMKIKEGLISKEILTLSDALRFATYQIEHMATLRKNLTFELQNLFRVNVAEYKISTNSIYDILEKQNAEIQEKNNEYINEITNHFNCELQNKLLTQDTTLTKMQNSVSAFMNKSISKNKYIAEFDKYSNSIKWFWRYVVFISLYNLISQIFNTNIFQTLRLMLLP
ncbi:MAG: hypothetical protein WC725_05260 [Patescibacteria group bacterium]|jgi:hypothetical protein